MYPGRPDRMYVYISAPPTHSGDPILTPSGVIPCLRLASGSSRIQNRSLVTRPYLYLQATIKMYRMGAMELGSMINEGRR